MTCKKMGENEAMPETETGCFSALVLNLFRVRTPLHNFCELNSAFQKLTYYRAYLLEEGPEGKSLSLSLLFPSDILQRLSRHPS